MLCGHCSFIVSRPIFMSVWTGGGIYDGWSPREAPLMGTNEPTCERAGAAFRNLVNT